MTGWNNQLAHQQVLPAEGQLLFAHLVFILFSGKGSWQLMTKVKIQTSPSLE